MEKIKKIPFKQLKAAILKSCIEEQNMMLRDADSGEDILLIKENISKNIPKEFKQIKTIEDLANCAFFDGMRYHEALEVIIKYLVK